MRSGSGSRSGARFAPAVVMLASCLALLAAPSEARAQGADNFGLGAESNWYMLGGLSGGGSFGSPGGGGFLGGELSVVRLKQGFWMGLYADGAYDFGHGLGTFTLGPELGYTVLGLDGGIGLRVGGEEQPEIGGQLRLLVSMGLFSIFGRWGYWPNSERAQHVGQVGVLLKLPIISPWGLGPK